MTVDRTAIPWTDATWSPARGCSPVSAGCANCYAARMASRFAGPGGVYESLASGGKWTGRARFVPSELEKPLRWRKPRRVFVCSMSDLFHEDITGEQIAAVFGVMAASPDHTFQILTKRVERMRRWFKWVETQGRRYQIDAGTLLWSTAAFCNGRLTSLLGWNRESAHEYLSDRGISDWTWPLPNVWLGVTAENQAAANERIPLLLDCPAAVRFVSCEPLLGPIDMGPPHMRHLMSSGVDWVIVGGESGPGARQCHIGWIRDIVQQCRDAEVPAFVKQLGARPTNGTVMWPTNDRSGADMEAWPNDLRVQEWPDSG